VIAFDRDSAAGGNRGQRDGAGQQSQRA